MATTASPSSLAARPRSPVLSLAAAAAAFPIAVLTHELGHLLVYLLLGVPGVELHYASASFAGSEAFWEHIRAGDRARAAQIAPVAGVAASSGAGLAISFITVLACAVLASRGRTHPFIAGLGLAASLRFLVALPALLVTVRGQPLTGNIDELNFALLTGVPATLLFVVGAIWLLGAWFFILRALLRHGYRDAVTVVGGVVLGGILYAGVLGPLVLP